MKLLENLGRSLKGAVKYAEDKNRRVAVLNRIRSYLRTQERAAEREYLALGRYYYHNLRDKNDPVTEGHCAELDSIEANLANARGQLDYFYSVDHPEEGTIGVIYGEDGPTAVYTTGDVPAEYEEVTLDDVQCFDTDPTEAADPSENDDLPFEG